MRRHFVLCVIALVFCFLRSVDAQSATTTTVLASPATGPYGTQVVVSAGVATTTPYVGAGGAVTFPSGTVNFFDGGTALNTLPVALTRGAPYTTVPFSSFFGTIDPVFTDTVGQLANDFNQDGNQDLLVYMNLHPGPSNPSNQQIGLEVQTLLSDGKGGYAHTLAQALTFPSPTPLLLPAFAPVVIDVNGDGKADLLIGPWVAYGNGDGTFQQPAALPFLAAGGYVSTDAVDVNHDGKLDIVGVSASGNQTTNAIVPIQITVFLNQGGGNFQAGQTSTIASGGSECPCSSYPFLTVKFVDVNGDGKPDIFAQTLFLGVHSPQNFIVPVTISLNNGDGTFATPVSLIYTRHTPLGGTPFLLTNMQFGDFNGDGNVDLVLIYPAEMLADDSFSTTVNFFPGAGNGTFGAQIDSTLYSPSPRSGHYLNPPTGDVVVMDADFDGKQDLVFGSGASAIGDGYGNFSQSTSLFSGGNSLGFIRPAGSAFSDLVGLANYGGSGTVSSPNYSSVATLPAVQLSAGTHTITASYTGDSHYSASNSRPFIVTIGSIATTTGLTSSANPAYASQAVIYTVTVANSGPVATGNVTLTSGSATLGSGSLDATGKVSITASIATVGNPVITASYAGDANHVASTANLTESIVQPFTVQGGAGSTTITVAAGQSASAQLSVTAAAGYSASVALTCSGLPAYASCVFNPRTLALTGGGSQTSILTVSTAGAKTAGLVLPGNGGVSRLSYGVLAGGMLLLLPRPRRLQWLAIFVLGCALPFAIGCSSSPSSGGGTGTTPKGTYTFNVVAASGSMQTTTAYTLNVQ